MAQFNSVDDIVLGARYRDIISGFEGIAVSKTEHISGCDRITLEKQASEVLGKLDAYNIDVTSLVYVDEGVIEELAEHQASNPNPEAVKPGGPTTAVSLH